MLKRKLFFYFSLFGLFFWTCTSSPKVVSTGSLIENRNQSGRLEVANIIDVSIKSKQISLYCDIYNTGNSDLVLPDLSETIQVLFDDDELKKIIYYNTKNHF